MNISQTLANFLSLEPIRIKNKLSFLFEQSVTRFYKSHADRPAVMKAQTNIGSGRNVELIWVQQKVIRTCCWIEEEAISLPSGHTPPSHMSGSYPYNSVTDVWRYIHITPFHTSAHALHVLHTRQSDICMLHIASHALIQDRTNLHMHFNT